ncbi:TMV resistance protein N-like [Rosa rugosa]|uniref:TMV resistance protein N-like n=1 Tax=Rosa rugosa TaxID=74645 RepID=UPI002B413CA7|nr:TMV resistance protein N-like [Rosa rugosa]
MKKNNVCMVGIWGAGGIGKTTIAKAMFNSIHREFEGSCFLADVRSNSSGQKGLSHLQQTLLFNILGDSSLKVHNVDEGICFMRKRMQDKKVLLILDDVSDLNQLDNLALSSDCFGPGSRIIITTRDRHLLTAHQVQSIYEVKMLNDAEALELFSWNAFNCNGLPDDFVELANRAVRYAQGLPLALIVVGRHLFARRKEHWDDALDSYKRVPHKNIQDILKISFDALEDYVKELFLDIACFFKGDDVNRVIPILVACDRNPVIGFELLKEKALITMHECEIEMHDLIEEMGKEIVRKQGEPGERSRLWNYDDVDHVLTDNTGTEKIKGIQVQSYGENDEICLNAKSFSKMTNLVYFSSNYFVDYSGNIDRLSNKLRWLDWWGCPIQSFPSNFHPRKLVALNIPYNPFIIRLWEGLKVLNLI